MSMPATTDRVAAHTSEQVNERIRQETDHRVQHYAAHPDLIDGRLRELDEEWNIERMLEANAATLAFSGALLAAVHDRRWIALPAVVTAFLLQHAVQGWCPPVPILRRLGFRTPREIEIERNALKAMRGDYAMDASKQSTSKERSRRTLEAARL
jgi:hypothetical protein